MAEKINELNKKRQEQEREIQEQAEEQIQTLYSKNDAAFVLDSNNSKEDHLFWQHWHPGIIGIVAGRLSEKYCRPVVVLTYNERNKSQATGSARGISEFDLYEAFETCKKHLESFGGHIAAAGLTIEKGNIPMFREAFVEYCKEKIDDKLQQSMQTLWLDGEYPFSAFSFNTVQQIEKLAPFGCENRRPFFSSTNVYLESPAKRMGADGQHFSATFLQDGIAFRGIAFGRGDWVDKMNEIFEKSAMSLFNIAFHVVLNTFAGRTKVELQIVDWNPAEK